MKKLFASIIIFTIVPYSIQASIIDQSQGQFDTASFVISPDWLIAQTFTAGISGQLEKVDLYLANIFDTALYPCTVSIVNVISDVPSGSVLGEVYTGDLVDGLNSINFLAESVFLTAGTKYGIIISNNDTEHYTGISTQWSCKSTDIYAGGSAWSWMSGTGWTQSVQPPGESLPVETFYDKDAAFRTHMLPEQATICLLALGALLLRKRKT